MKRIICLLAFTALLCVGIASPAQAAGDTGYRYLRCNSGLYITVQTYTTQDATVTISDYGQRQYWGNYWRYSTFNTRKSYGYWRAYTSGAMDYSRTTAYCSPY